MTAFEMYLVLKLDNIINLCVAVVIISGVISAIICMLMMVLKSEGERIEQWHIKIAKYSSVACFIFALLLTFLPTTKQMAAIKLVPMILESRLPDDATEIYRLGIEKLKDVLKTEGSTK